MLHINKTNRTDVKLYKNSRNIPLCIKCKHYTNNHCKVFIGINLINGQEKQVSAYEARNKHELCGYSGVYYKPVIAIDSNPPDLLPEN
jgi:hypothetical protein